jgi:hypothetical protein
VSGATEATVAATERMTRRRGADRLTVLLVSVAGFLVVLALLATELRTAAAPSAHRVVLIRRIYQTTVVETVGGGSAGPAVTESVSSTGSGGPAAPTTRTS